MIACAHDRQPVSPLLTDLHQLTMLQAYWRYGLTESAVFEFFVRRMPRRRNFLLAAGPGQPLLVPVMHDGRRLGPAEPMSRLRERAAASLASLPERLRALDRAGKRPLFQPQISLVLRRLAALADRRIAVAMRSSDLS